MSVRALARRARTRPVADPGIRSRAAAYRVIADRTARRPNAAEMPRHPVAARIATEALRNPAATPKWRSPAATVRRPPGFPSALPISPDLRVGTLSGLSPGSNPNPATEGASIVQRRTGMAPGPSRAALCRRRHRMPASPVRFFRRENGRLTRKSGAAYTAPPDAVRKKNGAGRTDFPRFRKVDLAKAEVLDFSSASDYESDY